MDLQASYSKLKPDSKTLKKYHTGLRKHGARTVIWLPVFIAVGSIVRLILSVSWNGPRVPRRGGALIVCNHLSTMDAIFIAINIGRPVHFLAKEELFATSWGPTIANLGAIPIQRGKADEEAIETAKELLEKGKLVAIFPQGKRSDNPMQSQAHRGAARLALAAGVPIIPLAITGSDKKWHFRARIRISAAQHIHAEYSNDPQAVNELTDELWSSILEQWQKIS